MHTQSSRDLEYILKNIIKFPKTSIWKLDVIIPYACNFLLKKASNLITYYFAAFSEDSILVYIFRFTNN